MFDTNFFQYILCDPVEQNTKKVTDELGEHFLWKMTVFRYRNSSPFLESSSFSSEFSEIIKDMSIDVPPLNGKKIVLNNFQWRDEFFVEIITYKYCWLLWKCVRKYLRCLAEITIVFHHQKILSERLDLNYDYTK